MPVLLARHGQTEWNALGRRQGQLDSPLTAAGVEQAHRHAKTVAVRGIDGIFTSPLGRALTTAEIIAGASRTVRATRTPTTEPRRHCESSGGHETHSSSHTT
jgi:broad specificity phosphatase PhoE